MAMVYGICRSQFVSVGIYKLVSDGLGSRSFWDKTVKTGVSMRILLGIAAGAAVGFAVGYFGRCSTGTCPLTSNPWVSTLVGAFMGLMMTAA